MKIEIKDKIKIETKISEYVKECNENGWSYDTKDLQIIRNAQMQSIIHNKFCDENWTINCIEHNPKNVNGIGDNSFALVDISSIEEELKCLEDDIVKPLNKFYKDKGGKGDFYIHIGDIIDDCLKKGVEEICDPDYFRDFRDKYLEEQENDILEHVESEFA